MENAPRQQVTTSQWLLLKPETRDKLREIFFIPKSSCVEVVTDMSGIGHVMSDGTTHKDLATITVEKMRDYLGQELTTLDETFNSLFEKVVAKIEIPAVVEMVAAVVIVADAPVCQPDVPCVEETKEPIKEEPVVDQPRTIECSICKKIIKCKDAKFDHRIMLMHTRKYHK